MGVVYNVSDAADFDTWIDGKGKAEEVQYRDWETDRKSTRLNSSHLKLSRMPSSA